MQELEAETIEELLAGLLLLDFSALSDIAQAQLLKSDIFGILGYTHQLPIKQMPHRFMATGQSDLGNSKVVSRFVKLTAKANHGTLHHIREVKARTQASSHATTIVNGRER